MKIFENYNFSYIEKKWYQYWIDNKYFKSEFKNNKKKSYTVIMPPPNITGILHMGHILNNSLQDVLIRIARMKGYNACWIPGLDHASIATESKIINQLYNSGFSKHEIGRKNFLEKAWEWSNKHSNIIINQLKKLGCSCDWDRIEFTMNKKLSNSVTKIFIDLYNKGYLYKDYRILNWDTKTETTLSDDEVIYKSHNGKLFYIKYKIENEEKYITVATTRPETIFGDVAICINPNDERYFSIKGKKIIIPIVNRSIPIIEDNYVNKNFGTGCLKITPAHDVNDKIIADKYNLDIIDIFNKNGTLNKNGFFYENIDRFDVRKKIIKVFKDMKIIVKIENYNYKLGFSERTNTVVEKRLSTQWFINMKKLIKPILKKIMDNNEINFYPNNFKKNYKNWINKIHDWNISRQLWWGHRIPVYYYGDNKKDFVVANNIKEALKKIRVINNKFIKKEEVKQDPNVLDTWFSSWIWPISIFDGICNPNNKEMLYYYPVKDLVTGPDILFFWVTRMILAGYTFTNKKPFRNIYFTGIVRDKYGKKMSKSLGNSPDPICLINKYGADSIRIGILLNTQIGNDLFFNENLFIQGRNFSNKIWNAFKLINHWKLNNDNKIKPSKCDQIALIWIENYFYKTLHEIEIDLSNYKISNALMKIYKFMWKYFCSWYLEIIKPKINEFISRIVFKKTLKIFENILKILHPYMPFITEELWHNIKIRSNNDALIINNWPSKKTHDNSIIELFKKTENIIIKIRDIKKIQNIYNKKTLLYIITNNKKNNLFDPIILKLANLSKLIYIKLKPKIPNFSFILDLNEYILPIDNKTYDIKIELKKLEKDIFYQKNFLKKIRSMLLNNSFLTKAPKKIVDRELKKEKDIIKKIKLLELNIEKIKSYII